jgi:hypothetical protein
MMSQRETLFYKNKIYLDNLPAKLHTHLFLVELINKKQISLYSPDNSELHLTLKVNSQTAFFPSSISISMVTSHPANESHHSGKLITKTYNYTFCYKNVAEWCEVDEHGKETSDNNPSAYVFAEYSLLKEQTDVCVKTIIKEIKRFKPDEPKSKEDDACKCTLF